MRYLSCLSRHLVHRLVHHSLRRRWKLYAEVDPRNRSPLPDYWKKKLMMKRVFELRKGTQPIKISHDSQQCPLNSLFALMGRLFTLFIYVNIFATHKGVTRFTMKRPGFDLLYITVWSSLFSAE